MEDKKTVSVRIGNMTYQISAKENSTYISEIAAEADKLVKSIQSQNPNLNSINLAILALINAIDQKTKLEKSLDSDESELLTLQKKNEEINSERLKLRELCWDLKKELLYYKNLCEVYEDRINDFNQIKEQAKGDIKGKTKIKPLDKLQTSFSEFNELNQNDS
ncbi:MAG: cell division protein ZapA [Clostridiaceae bacterium]|nr:cell division protein ZapA [Clostridiaceae bacterium]